MASRSLPSLDLAGIEAEARAFAEIESVWPEPSLYGVTDGKAIGTYIELKFRKRLADRYLFEQGNAANGVDFPGIGVDVKTTSSRQPQSSCPYRSARQKVFGLGYHLLLFVYEKTDDAATRATTLNLQNVVFISKERTGDYTLTRAIRRMLVDGGGEEDLLSLFADRNLPLDEVEATRIAQEILGGDIPEEGFLTISNALQWRLQYAHAIREAGSVAGVRRL